MVKSNGVLLVEKAFLIISKESSNYMTSFVKKCNCSKCGHLNEKFDLAQYDFDVAKTPRIYKSCINCDHSITDRDLNDCNEIEFWNVMNLFIYGSKIGIFDPVQYISCPWCHKEEEYLIGNKGNVRRRCTVCHKLLVMRIDFQLNQDLKPLIKSRSGIWLEWYVWKLLSKNSKLKVARNNKWKIDGREVEVDVEIDSKTKPTAILCDTKSEPTFNIENFYLLAKKFKRLVLVTTQKKVGEKIIGTAKEHFAGNVVVVSGLSIEKHLLAIN